MEKLTYNALSSVAGIAAPMVARVVDLRGTASVWEKATGETSPAIAA
jgi:hypothetical protein